MDMYLLLIGLTVTDYCLMLSVGVILLEWVF